MGPCLGLRAIFIFTFSAFLPLQPWSSLSDKPGKPWSFRGWTKDPSKAGDLWPAAEPAAWGSRLLSVLGSGPTSLPSVPRTPSGSQHALELWSVTAVHSDLVLPWGLCKDPRFLGSYLFLLLRTLLYLNKGAKIESKWPLASKVNAPSIHESHKLLWWTTWEGSGPRALIREVILENQNSMAGFRTESEPVRSSRWGESPEWRQEKVLWRPWAYTESAKHADVNLNQDTFDEK